LQASTQQSSLLHYPQSQTELSESTHAPKSDQSNALPDPGKFSLEPTAPAPAARLTGKGHYGERFTHELTHPFSGFFIGRKNPEISLDLSDFTEIRTVSHKHCGIVFNKALNRFELENYGRNGTRLNGELFGKGGETKRPLKSGDKIEIGKVQLTFTHVNTNQ
jgi:hypothetical protein